MTNNRTHALNENYFKEIDTEDKAYWLGFITADGNVYNGTLTIKLSAKDKDHLYKFKESIESEAPVIIFDQVSHRNKLIYHNMARFAVTSIKMFRDLGALGIVPNKGATVEPWIGPEELMRHYWRGMIDGDGGIGNYDFVSTTNNKQYNYNHWQVTFCGNYACVNGFNEYVKSKINYLKSNPFKSVRDNVWIFSSAGTWAPQTITKILYTNSEVHLDRKKILSDTLNSIDFGRNVKEITTEEVIETYFSNGNKYINKTASELGVSKKFVRSRLRKSGVTNANLS